MKKIFALSALMLVLAAPASFAGLDLGWGDCIIDTGTGDVVLPCAGFAGADLYGNFQLGNDVPQFIALDISLDLQTATDPSGSFWNFAGGECNDGNLTLDDARFGDCLSGAPTMCFATGAQCQNGFAWATGFGGGNSHRIVGSLFRDAAAPVALVQATDYFAFKFSFFTFSAVEGGGGACVGCTDEAAIVWNSALASGLSAGAGTEAQEEPIEGPGQVSNCAGINNGTAGQCDATPTQNRTWGQVKSLYR